MLGAHQPPELVQLEQPKMALSGEAFDVGFGLAHHFVAGGTHDRHEVHRDGGGVSNGWLLLLAGRLEPT